MAEQDKYEPVKIKIVGGTVTFRKKNILLMEVLIMGWI